MKTIGMIGGLSWQSSAEYYAIINESVASALGGLHSAKCLLYSFDFHEVESLQHEGRWDEAAGAMIAAATRLEAAGAEALVICSNTMHRMADAVERAISIPLLHIADATATRIREANLTTVALLGTRFTMEESFYVSRLARHGLDVMTPPPADRTIVHDVIYEELCRGSRRPESRAQFVRIIGDLVRRGSEAVILGCTEIMLLVDQADSSVPVFDTTRIHAETAAQYATGIGAAPR